MDRVLDDVASGAFGGVSSDEQSLRMAEPARGTGSDRWLIHLDTVGAFWIYMLGVASGGFWTLVLGWFF